MRCERIALPTEPYPHGRFTNSIIINTQKKCKHNYINRFTNFNCYGKIFFTWRHGSAGRAFASHARGHRFESCCLHQYSNTLQKCRVFLLPVSATGSNSDGFTVPRAKLHGCDQGHTARDWPSVTIAVDESCCLHQRQTKKNINFLEKREGPITDFFFLYRECDCYLINIKMVIA